MPFALHLVALASVCVCVCLPALCDVCDTKGAAAIHCLKSNRITERRERERADWKELLLLLHTLLTCTIGDFSRRTFSVSQYVCLLEKVGLVSATSKSISVCMCEYECATDEYRRLYGMVWFGGGERRTRRTFGEWWVCALRWSAVQKHVNRWAMNKRNRNLGIISQFPVFAVWKST